MSPTTTCASTVFRATQLGIHYLPEEKFQQIPSVGIVPWKKLSFQLGVLTQGKHGRKYGNVSPGIEDVHQVNQIDMGPPDCL